MLAPDQRGTKIFVMKKQLAVMKKKHAVMGKKRAAMEKWSLQLGFVLCGRMVDASTEAVAETTT